MNTSLASLVQRTCAMLTALTLIVPASAATFSRIIGPFDLFPDSADTVRQIREAVFDESGGNQFLVVLVAGLDSTSYQALYRVNAANEFQRIVAAGTATSRGPVISHFGNYTLHGSTAYFVAFDAAFTPYLCKVTEPDGPVTQVSKPPGKEASTDLRLCSQAL